MELATPPAVLGDATDKRVRIDAEEVGLPGAAPIEIALLEWPSLEPHAPLAFLAHANGFCAALWAPVAERLRERFHVVAMDAPGHGDSPRPAEARVFEWTRLAAVHAAVAKRCRSEAAAASIALGVGHSFGGTLTFCSSAEEPGLFERVALLDPVIFPPELFTGGARNSENGRRLAERALKRRNHWASRAEARAFLAEKELFAGWEPRSFDLYIGEALYERADGSVALKCDPAVESAVFENNGTLDPIGSAPRQRAKCLILRAGRGDFPAAVHERLARETPDAQMEEIDAGHLIPMERAEAVSERLLRFVRES